MSLVWQNLSFSGDTSIWNKLIQCCCSKDFCRPSNSNILTNLNGVIHLGELTALMGPSGAGKSTLLKCITEGRKCTGFNGLIYVGQDEEVRACFITQDEKDHLLLNLTVDESLWYASEMKNAPYTPKWKHQAIVNGLISDLKLKESRGNLVEKCSGGEKKRLAIGLELTSVEKPNFLFLDEPTSGLDSCAGLLVVKLLARIARAHQMAIVATIHQPSFEILSIFNQAYVISKTGNCIFSGNPAQLSVHLRESGYTCQMHRESFIGSCLDKDNPADSIIKIGSSVSRDSNSRLVIQNEDEEEAVLDEDQLELKYLQDICEGMTQSVQQDLISKNAKLFQRREPQQGGLCKNNAHFSGLTLWVLFKRACLTSIFRQRKLILIRFALHGIVAAMLAGLFNNTGMGSSTECFTRHDFGAARNNCHCGHTEKDLRRESNTAQNVKFQFFSLLFLMFAALMPTVLTFPAEIKLFLNEHRNGWYTTLSYYISKTITEIPLQFVFPFFYTYFLYWYSEQIGMDTWYGGLVGFMSWRYVYFLCIILLSGFIAQGLGFLIGITCVRSFNITVIVSSSVLLFLSLFSGFFVKTFQMGPLVNWMTYFSFVRFTFESLLIIIYGFDRCMHISNPNPNMEPAALVKVAPPRYRYESAVLFIFDLEDSDLLKNVFWLIGHLIATRLLAFLLLKYLADPSSLRPPTSLSLARRFTSLCSCVPCSRSKAANGSSLNPTRSHNAVSYPHLPGILRREFS